MGPLLRSLNRLAAGTVGVMLVRAVAPAQPFERRGGRLPPGAEAELRPDHPRLVELARRYAAFDPDVTASADWHPHKLAPEHLLWFRADNPFLWQLRGPNKADLHYALCHYALKDEAADGLIDRLGEDDLFGAHLVEVEGRPVSRDLLDSLGEIRFLRRHAGFGSGPRTLLDIGAGYGRLAWRLTQAEPHAKVIAADAFPASTFVCDYYLRFRGAGRARAVPLDEIEAALATERIDIAVNVHSFSECRPEAVAWWLRRLADHAVPKLMVVPNEGGCAGERCRFNDGTDMEPILARFGYRIAVREPRYRDPVVQANGLDPVHLHLFERA